MDEVTAGRGSARPIRVGVIGFGWMGRVHSQAYARVRHHFPDLPLVPELVVVADEVPGRAEQAAAQFGFTTAVLDWREVLTDSRVEAVSVTAPNWLHREIGIAVAEAGRHLWIEKPVGVTVDDARAVCAAVDAAGVQSAVGFNYRNAPAVAMARDMIAADEIGRVTHARFYFLSDYAASPEGALTWRYERARGGSGVLGDLASHAVDLVRFLLGDIASVVADTAIFIPARARPAGATAGHARVVGGELGPVENEDYVSALLRLDSGPRVVLEASRVAVGDQNAYGFEVHGTTGALSWDFRRMGELSVSRGGSPQDQSVATVRVGPGAGQYAAFQPGAGIAMGYDDLKVVEARDFLRAIADGRSYGPDVQDAVRAARTVDALAASSDSGSWIDVPAHQKGDPVRAEGGRP
jgi:predicted dehydrogenase